MDPNLHQKMGINHLNRVLGYAPFVMEEGKAEVHLTAEDWHVVADTLFAMQTPREMLPGAIKDYALVNENTGIELKTEEMTILVSIM